MLCQFNIFLLTVHSWSPYLEYGYKITPFTTRLTSPVGHGLSGVK